MKILYIIEESIVEDGILKISEYIKGYNSYSSLYNELSDDKLWHIIKNGKQYEKIIAIRFMIERKNILTELRRKYPGACKFLNESNHIENDYILQLDPRKYFSVPSYYFSQLEKFINEKI